MRRIIGLLLINGAGILLLQSLTPHFLTVGNLSAILSNLALEAIVLAGVTLLLIAGLFDLSVDGVVAMTGVICGKLLVSGVQPYLACLLALGLGAGAGWFNGQLVCRWRINPLIATLGTWWVWVGVAYGITKAISPFGFPAAFQVLGQTRILGLRVFVWYAIFIVGVLAWALAYTRFGQHVYILGGNREAGRRFGIQVDQLGQRLYILMGILAAIVGIVMAARLNVGSPNATDGMTLRVIAAAVIGGCALSGGYGSILGGLLGLLLMNLLTNAATLLGLSPYWQKSVIGGVLLLAVLLDAASGKLRAPAWARKLSSL